jgi:lipopolysaccharide export system permease protein
MIINRAFVLEVLRTAIAVTFVIVCIFLVMRVMGFLSQAAEGVIPLEGVFVLVALKMISYLDVMMPLMFFIALLMVLNRWYADQEMAVLASAGVGLAHFLKPLTVLVIVLTTVVAAFAFYLTPMSIGQGRNLENQYRQSNEISGIETGKFVEAKDGNGVYFVEKYNRETGLYENVFVHRKAFDREGVVVSKSAYRTEDEKTEDQFLVLVNGTRYEGVPGSPDYRVIDFERYALRIETRQQSRAYVPIRARPNVEVMTSDNPKLKSEWYWRLGKIFTLPVLALFALALSHVDTRRGKSSGMVIAFLVYLTYTNLLGYAVALIRQGQFETGAPVWFVHGMFFLFALYCLWRRIENLPLLPEIRRNKQLSAGSAT